MSVTQMTTTTAATETSGLFAEAVGGVATIALAIIALAGTASGFLLAVATIVFGAALLIEGTSIVSDYAHVISATDASVGFQTGSGGLAAVFITGLTGIILGILAVLGLHSLVLISAAVIAFGASLLLSSSSLFNLHMVKSRLASETVMGSAATGSSGAQALAGVAAIVLGILAVSGVSAMPLDLVALLVLGAAILVTGNGMNNAMIGMFNHVPRRAPVETMRPPL
jgi:hypothetical protein